LKRRFTYETVWVIGSEGPREGCAKLRTAVKQPAKYDVAILKKALDLLEQLAGRAGPAGLSDLGRQADVSKATAYRILQTLEARGYLVKSGRPPVYIAGPKLIAVSARFVSGSGLVQAARPILADILLKYEETVNLAVLDGCSILYLDVLESPRRLRRAAQIGSRDPIHSTALGKAIVAFLPQIEAARILTSYHWKLFTRKTIVTVDAFERDMADTRQRGYALDNEENELGARCVGVPICGGPDRPIGAVSVSGPASRLGLSLLREIGEHLKQAAREIEARMGMPLSRL